MADKTKTVDIQRSDGVLKTDAFVVKVGTDMDAVLMKVTVPKATTDSTISYNLRIVNPEAMASYNSLPKNSTASEKLVNDSCAFSLDVKQLRGLKLSVTFSLDKDLYATYIFEIDPPALIVQKVQFAKMKVQLSRETLQTGFQQTNSLPAGSREGSIVAGSPFDAQIIFNRHFQEGETANIQCTIFRKDPDGNSYKPVPAGTKLFKNIKENNTISITLPADHAGATMPISFFVNKAVTPNDRKEDTVLYAHVKSKSGVGIERVYWSEKELITFGEETPQRNKIFVNEDAFLHIHTHGMFGQKVKVELFEDNIGPDIPIDEQVATIQNNVLCLYFTMSEAYNSFKNQGHSMYWEGGDLEFFVKVTPVDIKDAKTVSSNIIEMSISPIPLNKAAKSTVKGTKKFVIKDSVNGSSNTESCDCENCSKDITLKDMQDMFPKVADSTLQVVADAYNKYMKPLRMNTCWNKAHFFAQVAVETGYKLDIKTGEDVDFSKERMYELFQDKFFKIKNKKPVINKKADYKDDKNREFKDEASSMKADELLAIADKQERKKAIANYVYAGGTTGNGDEDSGDGWRFRGSGLIQLTGRYNFTKVQSVISSLWTKSILTDEGADEVRTNLELAILTSMGYFVFKKLRARANVADTDKEILDISKGVGNKVTNKDGTNNWDLKKDFFNDHSSGTFMVNYCKLGKTTGADGWHEPVDNPQIAIFTQSGYDVPRNAAFGHTRKDTRDSGVHQALDLFALEGSYVYACLSGKVVCAQNKGKYGNIVIVEVSDTDQLKIFKTRKREYTLKYADDGEESEGAGFSDAGPIYFRYAHLSEILVSGEEIVTSGNLIGESGTTGIPGGGTCGPHVYFEIASSLLGELLDNRINPGFYVYYKDDSAMTADEKKIQEDRSKEGRK